MTDETPILDHAVVNELRESVGGDDEFVAELVGAYLAEGPGNLGDMVAASSAGDAAAIVRPAHTLKSSSAAIGAMRLAAICRSIEMAGREGRVDESAVAAAREAWTATVAELSAAGLAR